MSFSSGSSWPRNWAQVSGIAGGFFTIWGTRKALYVASLPFEPPDFTKPGKHGTVQLKRQLTANTSKIFFVWINYLILKLTWKCNSTPALLPGKSHGRRSLVGCSPWGHKESDTTVRLTLFTRGVIQGQSPHSYSVPFPLIPPGLQHILIQFEKRQEISLVTLYTYAALSVVCECVCVCVSVCVCTCVCIYMGVCFPQFEEGGNFPSKQRLSSLVISFYWWFSKSSFLGNQQFSCFLNINPDIVKVTETLSAEGIIF